MNKIEFENKFKSIASNLNINYKNIDLYYEAFVHPSFANEHRLDFHYERMEFLGDAILDFLVGEYIYKTQNIKEGEMTKIRAKYVCENANMGYTNECHLDECFMVGKGAKNQGENKKPSVLGNLFESFLGALYLDLGIEEVRTLLEKIVFPKIEFQTVEYFQDYKTQLQECIQAESRKSVEYKVVKEEGPAHNKTFEVIVIHENTKLGRGIGKSKKEAEQKAAQDALNKLAK